MDLSFSGISAFMRCPRLYWFQYLLRPKPPEVIDLPRLFGTFVHQHAQRMHRRTSDQRPMFYQSRVAAVKAGYYFWGRLLEENRSILQSYTEADLAQYRQLVAICINNYWNVASTRPQPLQIEWRLKARWNSLVRLVGVIDQVRVLDLDAINRLRPDLVVDGQLHPDYDKVALIDLKTNRASYTPWVPEGEQASLEVWARKQFPLHAYEQPTAYTWLYHEVTGKWPVVFVWWHLRSGKMYPTFRDQVDIRELGRTIDHVIDNLTAQSFPRNVGSHCAYCDYFRQCRGRDLLITDPTLVQGEVRAVPLTVQVADPKQLRLRFKVERATRGEPELPLGESNPVDVVYIGDPPWFDQTT